MADTKILLEEKDIPPHWYNVVAEPTSRPTLTRGHYAYDFGDAWG